MTVPQLLDSAVYTLTADVETHDFGRTGYDNVTTYAYNHGTSQANSYLGPTLIWRKGRFQTTSITNNLGADNTTTVHWHGADIPPSTDGGPHQTIAPGATFAPQFDILDNPSNLWYHPHAEDATYTQVQMGLAGMIIVEDPNDTYQDTLPHTYGTDEFPIIIQDLTVANDSIDTLQTGTRQAIVNGTIQPYLDVPPQLIRFRILDGSTRAAYMLMFVADTTQTTSADRQVFHIVGSDGGYVPDSARTVDSLYTGVGIRNDIVIDFTGMDGDSVYLYNLATSIPSATIGGGGGAAAGKALLKIKVGNTVVGTPGQIPATLPPFPQLGTPDKSRTIYLGGQSAQGFTSTNPMPDSLKFNINGRQFELQTIDDTVMFNTIEEWTVVNTSSVAHPFHIHLVQFQVQEVQDTAGNTLPFPVEMLGPKDDIMVQSGQQVIFRAHFNSYASPMPFNPDTDTYMYHCHILTHEDGYYEAGYQGAPTPDIQQRQHWGMMQQFVVWDGTVSRDFSQPLGDNMVLYPNPATDEINLNGESTKLSSVKIYDLQGRKLMEKMLPPFSGTTSLDVSQLRPGMVVVEWTSPEGKFTKKVVITR